MLQKSKSKKVWQLKYLVLVPLIAGMLFYTSCEGNDSIKNTKEDQKLEEVIIIGYAESKSGKKVGIEVPFTAIDQVPVFPGCENAEDKRACFQEKIQEHVRKHFNYPAEAIEKGIQGRVNMMFTMDEEGNITNIHKRGAHSLLENESERIISRLPQMQAGVHQGKAVRVPFSIPITFRLENEHQLYDEVLFSEVDEVPVFPTCESANDTRACFKEMMISHIRKNFKYPEEALDSGIQGTVKVLLTIGKDGQIDDLRFRGPNDLLEKEAKRIMMKLPRMVPGKNGGVEVNVTYAFPITFELRS